MLHKVKLPPEQGKTTTGIYPRPIFSGAESNFDSFLLPTSTFPVVYTLVYRSFCICKLNAVFTSMQK